MEFSEVQPKKYSPEQAWLKICKWCAYQERSQQEVRDKLFSYGLYGSDVENMIARLITEKFLSEERFAIAYAEGKFRQLGWGKVKIRQALKFKKVSAYCILKALQSIPDTEYRSRLAKLLEKKEKEAGEKDPVRRYYKLYRYALSRGYEADYIQDFLRDRADG